MPGGGAQPSISNAFAVFTPMTSRIGDNVPVPELIDPRRIDLAREFRGHPWGPHSAELQRILNVMRAAPLAGKHIILMSGPYRRWSVARLTGVRGEPVERIEDLSFDNPEDAEWSVFKLRWEAHTGQPLDLD